MTIFAQQYLSLSLHLSMVPSATLERIDARHRPTHPNTQTATQSHARSGNRQVLFWCEIYCFFHFCHLAWHPGKVLLFFPGRRRKDESRQWTWSCVESFHSHWASHHKFINCIKYLFESFNSCHRVVHRLLLNVKMVRATSTRCRVPYSAPANPNVQRNRHTKQTRYRHNPSKSIHWAPRLASPISHNVSMYHFHLCGVGASCSESLCALVSSFQCIVFFVVLLKWMLVFAQLRCCVSYGNSRHT